MSTTETAAYDGTASGPYWREQLDHAMELQKNWQGRGTRVVERYRDERAQGKEGQSKFNILWSNVQVLKPSLYGRPAKPEVSRRYMDSDPVGRLASTMLERVLEYEVQQFPDFDEGMRSSVEDRLLPGRGTVWIRVDRDIEAYAVDKSYSPVDYVFWKDFLHSPARTWEEVWWVARRAYMTREAGVARFGEKFNDVPLDFHKQETSALKEDKSDKAASSKTAEVWEVWNERTRKVCWIAEGFEDALDEKDDPLKLEGFFPCPKPLYATTTNGSLIPVPDYCQYQDQAEEIDKLTERSDELSNAIRVAGVYNSEFKELGRLFQTKGNKLIGVANWAALAEKQGLKGAIDLIDLQPIAQALALCNNVIEAKKQAIYEICGISDILRGSTKAEETLGAQQLKANFGSLRLRSSQVDVARYATDIFRLKAQVICAFYPSELIVQMSGVMQTEDGKNVELLTQALAMLQDSTIRDFHIEVESDTLAQIDEAAEKEEAATAVMAIGGLIKEAIPMVQMAPATIPLAKNLLLFVARKSKGGRELEASIEQTMAMLEQQMAQAAANPQPSPEEKKAMIEAQVQAKADEMRAQTETMAHQMKAQADQQTQQAKLAQEERFEAVKAQLEERMAAVEGQIKIQIAEMDNATKRYVAELQAKTQLATATIGAQVQADANEKGLEGEKIKKEPTKPDPEVPKLSKRLEEFITESKKQPKNKKVIRDKDNRIVGVEAVDKVQ